MATAKLHDLERRTRGLINRVTDNPQGRYTLRDRFYDLYGHAVITAADGLGNSELAFMRWEIKRGVLNPLDHPTQPGSAWWREMNAGLIYDAELAGLIYQSDPLDQPVPKRCLPWLAYIQAPTPKAWYRAHNTGIISGYLDFADLARGESVYEQVFMNEVLYRLLYAQAMVEGAAFAQIGEVLANPRLPSVDLIVHQPDFYPTNYPLSEKDIKAVLHKGLCLDLSLAATRFLDQMLILPQITELYQFIAKTLEIPQLMNLVAGGKPVYPKGCQVVRSD